MRNRTRVALLVLLAGCAAIPPEREERDRAILKALEPCRQRYSDYFHLDAVRVRQDGQVWYVYQDYQVARMDQVNACINEAVKGLKLGPFAPGRLSGRSGPASVAVSIVRGELVLVRVSVNGVAGRMLLVTDSAITLVRPAYAKKAGLEITQESPTTRIQYRDQTLLVPFVRAKSVSVGSASVESLDIVVFDPPGLDPLTSLDGVLGSTFLSHFNVDVDRRNNQLTLETKALPSR